MPSFGDDDDRSAASQDNESENDADETMRDVDDEDDQGDDQGDEDMDGDNDNDEDGEDGDDDGDDDEGEGGDDDDAQSEGSQGSNKDQAGDDAEGQDGSQSAMPADVVKELSRIPNLRPEVLTASNYDIVPTIAAPQSTSINAVCATADTRWVFTGGSDGYIRQYNWADSVNAKLALTVAQRHPFVDSVVKAGVLMTYWENWDTRPGIKGDISSTTPNQQVLSPVYSLACHSQALWLLSGTASGQIKLQSVRHDEGREIYSLDQHKSAVAALTLSSDERSLLSGSWDKTVLDWDLDTGKVRTSFAPTASQIACIESRPVSNIAVPPESGEITHGEGNISSNNEAPPRANGIQSVPTSPPIPKAATPDSLFGGDDGDDDLFGDGGGGVMGNEAGGFGYEEDEIAHDIAADPPAEEPALPQTDDLTENATVTQEAKSPPKEPVAEPVLVSAEGVPNTQAQPLANGLPHAEDVEPTREGRDNLSDEERPVTSDSTFLAASIDGAIRIWDRRESKPVARIVPRNTPPWCVSACWSKDGNNIYAGRRNNTVEEYDLRKGLKSPERVFRFPNGSGAVTSVKAMPNGRHLICASYDILRLYDLKQQETARSTVPFLIVPGHRTGVISHLYMDPACRFLMSTGGNRGWEGQSTEVILGYEINVPS